MAIRLAGFEIRDMICWHYGSGFPKSLDISKAIDKSLGAERKITKNGKPKSIEYSGKFDQASSKSRQKKEKAATIESEKATGWGTALKPATEPICMARKPIEGTVAENFMKYGPGGINLDGCRIKIDANDLNQRPNGSNGVDGLNSIFGIGGRNEKINGNTLDMEKGRFPANVIFDDFMGNELDKQTGELTSGKPCGQRNAQSNIYGVYQTGQDITGFGDSGGASRFFYCAKSSQFERHAGCENLGYKDPADIIDFRPTKKTNPENWDYLESPFSRTTPELNNHPTVKPISLMRYLQRLVTPKGGKTLDPFAGSGTSGCSAYFEDIGEIVLMEMDESYLSIIHARTKYWSKEKNRNNYLEEIRIKPEEKIENKLKLL